MPPQRRQRELANQRMLREKKIRALPDSYPCPICGCDDSVTVSVTGATNYGRGRKMVTEKNENLGCVVTGPKEFKNLVAIIKCSKCDQKDAIAKGPPFKLPLDFYSFWADYYNNLEQTCPKDWEHIQRTNKVLRERQQKMEAIREAAKERKRRLQGKDFNQSELAIRTKGKSMDFDDMLNHANSVREAKEKEIAAKYGRREFQTPTVSGSSFRRRLIRQKAMATSTPMPPRHRSLSRASSVKPSGLSTPIQVRPSKANRSPSASSIRSSASFKHVTPSMSMGMNVSAMIETPNRNISTMGNTSQVSLFGKAPMTPKDKLIVSAIRKRIEMKNTFRTKRKLDMDTASVAETRKAALECKKMKTSMASSFIEVTEDPVKTGSNQSSDDETEDDEENQKPINGLDVMNCSFSTIAGCATPSIRQGLVSKTTITPVEDSASDDDDD